MTGPVKFRRDNTLRSITHFLDGFEKLYVGTPIRGISVLLFDLSRRCRGVYEPSSITYRRTESKEQKSNLSISNKLKLVMTFCIVTQ